MRLKSMNEDRQKVIEAIRVFVRGEELIEDDQIRIPVSVEDLTPEPAEIDIKIGKEINVKVKEEEPRIKVRVRDRLLIYLQIRKSLDGNYMIFDHPLFDIVIMPRKNKIVTFSKKGALIDSYPSQDKFFDYLMRKGVILADTIQSGNVFSSLEATYPINDDVDTIEALLLVMYGFLKEEVKDVKAALDYAEDVEDLYIDPDEEDSTELGEVPHAEKKGSIDPNYRPYGLIYRI